MSKKKLNTNGTLLNLLLLGGAAVILKKRTGSLRGVGAVDGYVFTEITKIGEREKVKTAVLNSQREAWNLYEAKINEAITPDINKYDINIDSYFLDDLRLAIVSWYDGSGIQTRKIFALLKKSRTTAIGATHSKEWIINYISHRLDVYDRQLPKLTDKNAIEKNVAVQEELHSILKHIYF